MFKDEPLVSVIMPVYNAEKYLSTSIESILQQTYKNFEFLIFNDGSTDRSLDIIKSYKDERIALFNSEVNLGYVQHLNKGIAIAKGPFIARMDADDISVKNRFKKQVCFLQRNPEIGILGSAIKVLSRNGSSYTWQSGKTHEQLKSNLLINTCFVHPSVMVRKKIFNTYKLQYDDSYTPAEDYKLWIEILSVSKGFNLSETLLFYRESDYQISHLRSEIQIKHADQARRQLFDLAKINATPEQLTFHSRLVWNDWVADAHFFQDVIRWFLYILNSNKKSHFFEQAALGELLGKTLFHHCYKYASAQFNTFQIFRESGLASYYHPSLIALLKLQTKTIFKY